MDILFYIPVVLYFLSASLQIAALIFKKNVLRKAALIGLIGGVAVHTAYIIARGIAAGRVPLANQFEFANAFAWGVALIGLYFRIRRGQDMGWIVTVCTPLAFLLISYAAQQPREITELMPALRSTWFVLHIGAAVFSYSAFGLTAGMGVRYLAIEKQDSEKDLRRLDDLEHKFICFGFMLLSVVIISGMIWAEQAWSSFWSWDPKEVWALITWIIYAICLHQRLRMKWRGKRMAWLYILAFIFVIFTFMGVNKLMVGLHSYA